MQSLIKQIEITCLKDYEQFRLTLKLLTAILSDGYLSVTLSGYVVVYESKAHHDAMCLPDSNNQFGIIPLSERLTVRSYNSDSVTCNGFYLLDKPEIDHDYAWLGKSTLPNSVSHFTLNIYHSFYDLR